MHILLTGATGFIGQTLPAALRAAGHQVHAGVSPRSAQAKLQPDQVPMDFARDTTPEAWLPRLQGIDAVHQHTPCALFQACAQAGVRRVVQISALGIDGSATRYARTKLAAEACLRSLSDAGQIDPVILRPSVVFGKGGDSSALFMNLARLPVVVFPAPMLTARIQPVSVHDLAAAVVALLGPALRRTGTIACTGPEPLRMADFVASLRQQQGHGPALVMRLPLPLTRLSARAGDLLPASVPWCSESLALLDSDNVGDPAEFEQLLGRSGVHYSRLVP